MIFNVTLDRDEDGWWVVECPAIPGCISQGATRDEALENIKDAIQSCLEVRAELGMPLMIETCQVEVSPEECPSLMELLEERSKPEATYTTDEVRKLLDLETSE